MQVGKQTKKDDGIYVAVIPSCTVRLSPRIFYLTTGSAGGNNKLEYVGNFHQETYVKIPIAPWWQLVDYPPPLRPPTLFNHVISQDVNIIPT